MTKKVEISSGLRSERFLKGDTDWDRAVRDDLAGQGCQSGKEGIGNSIGVVDFLFSNLSHASINLIHCMPASVEGQSNLAITCC